jgi:hypothetical protein
MLENATIEVPAELTLDVAVFGEMRLDPVRRHEVETLKAEKLEAGLSRKRVNNILACLGKILRYAHEIEELESVPKIELLKLEPQKFDFLTSRNSNDCSRR